MSKIKIEIKNRWTGSVLFEYEKENNTLKDTVEQAVKEVAYLREADLEGANLRGANLEGANLREADLEGANLREADLEGAYLREADLEGANLRGANLRGANLVGADLREADLEGANLRGADLEGANLRGADLEGAYIYLSDNEINTNDIVKQFEKDSNIKLTNTYINKNVVPTRWNCFWKYGLIICDWEIKEKEEITEESKKIEEFKTEYNTTLIEGEIINKLNEAIRVLNKERRKENDNN